VPNRVNREQGRRRYQSANTLYVARTDILVVAVVEVPDHAHARCMDAVENDFNFVGYGGFLCYTKKPADHAQGHNRAIASF
jgi:hypothetical protein